MAKLAVKANVKKFIYASTGSVYAPSFLPLSEKSPVQPSTWYTRSKLQAEEALQDFKNQLQIMILRPFAIFGPGQKNRLIPNLITSIKKNANIYLEPRNDSGSSSNEEGLRISFCYVEDSAAAVLHYAVHGGPPFVNLASQETLSIKRIAETIGGLYGKEPRFVIVGKSRKTDRIADVRLLGETCPVQFRSFRQGISSVINFPT